MKKANLLTLLTGLMIGFFLVSLGLFIFLKTDQWIETCLNAHIAKLSYFGLALFLIGVGFLSLLYYLNRRQYLLLTMGEISVDEKVIIHYVTQSLKSFFPDQPIECDIAIKRSGRLEIIANLPMLPSKETERTLEEIEGKLTLLLRKQFLYNRPFLFNISFFDPQPII